MIKNLRNRIKIAILNKNLCYGVRHIAIRSFLGSIRLYTAKFIIIHFLMKRVTYI